MERWNGGIVEWLDGRLTTLDCFAAVSVLGASSCNFSVRGRYSYDRLLVPGNCKLRPRSF